MAQESKFYRVGMSRLSREVITELSVMKIYLNSHKQRLGVTSLSARLLSLGTLPPSRSRSRPTLGGFGPTNSRFAVGINANILFNISKTLIFLKYDFYMFFNDH